MDPLYNLRTALDLKHKNGWDKIYVAVDLHGTIIMPSNTVPGVEFLFYTGAFETLKLMSKMPEICLILFTGSSPAHIKQFVTLCERHGIKWDYINCNPEATTSEQYPTADYSKKFYYNVLLDDRAGFEGWDWPTIHNFLQSWVEQH